MGKDRIGQVELIEMKKRGEPITMVTAYDYPTARIAEQAGMDTVLVGDSAGNVVLGYPDTLPVTVDELIHHTKAVRRGIQRAMLIGDMPFMSYNVSKEQAISNAGRFIKEAGADAVKIEGGDWVADTARAMVKAGIPVVGHLGLTPQTASSLGGYKVQGRTKNSAKRILKDALALQDAGVIMLVLELVPHRLGELLSRRLHIPVIGIGAGNKTDGQVLVFHDLVGIAAGFQPKFVKKYAEVGKIMEEALKSYCSDVKSRTFPAPEHCFSIPDEEFEQIENSMD